MAKARKKRRKNRIIASYVRFFAVKKWMVKASPKKGRFWRWMRLWFVTPVLLIFRYLRKDWHLWIYFAVWFVAVSCEVWFPYLMAVIVQDSEKAAWWASIGSACWLFWAGPFTPFLAIVLALTFATSALEHAIKRRRKAKKAAKAARKEGK